MTASAVHRTTLLTLSVDRDGSTTAERHALCDSDIAVDGPTWLAAPTIDIEPAPLTGAAQDDPWRITLPATGLALRLATGERMADVQVDLWTIDPTDTDTMARLWLGWVDRATRNPGGDAARIRLECGGIKSRASGVLASLRATSLCGHVLGDRHCHVDLDPLRETGTVDTILGESITVSGLTTLTDGHWARGYARRGDTRILIRDNAAATMVLNRPPPADWIDQEITLTPGCDKSEGTCAVKFENSLRFGGYGARMPLANPLLG